MSRYPYTECADAIRRASMDFGQSTPNISRAQAAAIKTFIARAIGMDEEELASNIADYAKHMCI